MVWHEPCFTDGTGAQGGVMWVAMPEALRLTHRQRCDDLTASGFTAIWLGRCDTRDLNKETGMNAHKTTIASVALATVGLFVAGTATANIVIDGTNPSAWTSGPPFQSSAPYSIVGTVTLTSNVGTVNINQNFDGSPKPASVLSLLRDGIGISDDEISGAMLTGGETLTVTFENPGTVKEIFYLDLYTHAAPEEITASFFDSSNALIKSVSSQAPAANDLSTSANGGYLAVAVNAANVKYFNLSMTNNLSASSSDDGSNDAAWAGATVVPIPAAVWLFGSALLGIAGIGYRRTV